MTAREGARVDATGTRRRLQAMVANGRTVGEVAGLLGQQPPVVGRLLRQDTVTKQTALAVSDLYDRLGDRMPKATSLADAERIAATRAFAARQGWPPSLAWEPEQLDDPAGAPDGGWNGWQRRKLRGPARWAAAIEDAAFMRDEEGLNTEQIAERLGVTKDALALMLARAREAAQQGTGRAQDEQHQLEAEAG